MTSRITGLPPREIGAYLLSPRALAAPCGNRSFNKYLKRRRKSGACQSYGTACQATIISACGGNNRCELRQLCAICWT